MLNVMLWSEKAKTIDLELLKASWDADSFTAYPITSAADLEPLAKGPNGVILLAQLQEQENFTMQFAHLCEAIKTSAKAVILISEKNQISFDVVQLLNEKIVDKIAVAEWNEATVAETCINAMVTMAQQLTGQDSSSEEAQMMNDLNAELQLKSEWMAKEKEITLLFSRIDLSLDEKLIQTFKYIVEQFAIEHFVFYQSEYDLTSSDENALKQLILKYSSMSSPSHVLAADDDASAVYTFFNRAKTLVNDYAKENRFSKNSRWPPTILTSLSVPIISLNKILGVVEFLNKTDQVNNVFPIHLTRFIDKLITELSSLIEINQLKEELFRSQKELVDIFDTVEEGILTVNNKNFINPEYSKKALSLFNKEKLSGVALEEVLYENIEMTEESSPVAEQKAGFKDWINSVFSTPDNWHMMEGLGPKSIVKVGDKKHYWDLHFKPIIKESAIDKVLLIISDVTKQKEATLRAEQEEQQHKGELVILKEILSIKPSFLKGFLADSIYRVEQVEAVLKDYHADKSPIKGLSNKKSILDNLFAHIHALKGLVNLANLDTCAQTFHKIETQLTLSQKKVNEAVPPALMELVQSETDYFSLLIKRLNELLDELTRNNVDSEQFKFWRNLDAYMKVTNNKGAFSDYSVFQLLKKNTEAWLEQYQRNMVDKFTQNCEALIQNIAPTQDKDIALTCDINATFPMMFLENLEQWLTPLLLNSIDHGIEPATERETSKKEITAKLKITAFSDTATSLTTIRVEDDGRGVNVQRVRATALKRGIKTEEQLSAMTEKQICELIFLPQFSTKEEVSMISGRGYGMDIVARWVNEMKGSIDLETTLGQGTRILIKVPMPVSAELLKIAS